MPSFTVENYVKAIYGLNKHSEEGASTNQIADALGTKAATVTDMLRKLSERKLINYKKYQGTTLTEKGKELALNIIRKHRLWEVFLVEKLDFKWDEVHDLAEELEHINSDELINRMEAFLDHPKFDPHGDPIPDRKGKVESRNQVALTDLKSGEKGLVTGVVDSSKEFLQYLDTLKIELGNPIEVKQIFEYDKSRVVKTNIREHTFSHQVCKNLFVIKQEE
ncbi:MAG: metal-dependent transcriptional regulator [Salibacteraceae bacterium]